MHCCGANAYTRIAETQSVLISPTALHHTNSILDVSKQPTAVKPTSIFLTLYLFALYHFNFTHDFDIK